MFGWIFLFVHLALAGRCVVHIAREKHLPTEALGWLMAVCFLPVLGSLLYYFTAWNGSGTLVCGGRGASDIEGVIHGGCGTRASEGNRVELLNNGSETYSALLAELQHARDTIHLEYYIFDDDRIGRSVAEVLIRRARGGVKVRVIYDLLGSWMPSWGMLRDLRRAGVEVRHFRPIRFPWITPELNERNHRKIAVIDGRIAFIGGINIARRYLDGNELGQWRDEHLRIEGEAVRDLQGVFAADWQEVGGTPFDCEESLRRLEAKGSTRTQIAWSQQGPTRRVIGDAMTALILRARDEILLSTPYFVPTEPLLRALCIAAAGGVKVRLMVPAQADLRIAMAAAESYFGDLLTAGGEIYRYEAGFLHTKSIVVDQHITYVGTANLDYRSLQSNWEVGAFIYDETFGHQAAATFRRDLEHCSRLTPEAYAARSRGRKALVKLASLLSPIL